MIRSAAQAWIDAVEALVGDAAYAARSGSALEGRYREPHRRHHNIDHVLAVINCAADLATQVALPPSDQAMVVLAACAHDVVYRGESQADERASADWARAELAGAAVDPAVIDEVCRLVLATITHDAATDDLRAAVLCDADLAVLALPASEYDAYAAAVRAEYAHVDDAAWRSGRAQVLQTLLSRSALYRTAPAQSWEAPARANLTRELQALLAQ